MADRSKKKPLNESEKRSLNKKSFQSLFGIFRFVLPYKIYFIPGLIFLILSSSILLILPYASGELINIATGKESWLFQTINQAAIVLIIVLVSQGLASYFRVLLFAHVSQKSMADIRRTLYEKYLNLPMSFHDDHRTGELTSRLTSDVTLLQDTLSTTLAEAFRQVLTLLAGLGIILYLTPRLSAFMLLTFPVVIIVAMVFGKFIKRLSKKTQDKLGTANTIAEESISSIWTIKSYTGERLGIQKYSHALQEVVKTAVHAATFRAAFISFIIVAIFGGIVGVMWYGATLVQQDSLQVGELISFILYTVFIGGSIAGLGDLYSQIQRAVGASERIQEILDEQNEIIDKTGSKFSNGDIIFEKVSFSYPSRVNQCVLNNLSLVIKENQTVAIVGPSGAGKTTIAQLLMRFYTIDTGSISIGSHSLEAMELYDLRKNIGVVPQDIVLFGGSIYENILYGNPDASYEEVVTAAREANALNFIEGFDSGFETLVGERGVKLSGGQRQRVAIARAILKNPRILILDEATSSLDTASEKLVQEALERLMNGRTTIVIAHRLSTIRKADNIIVLNEGQVQEQGSHEILLAKEDGLYRKLTSIQMENTVIS